MSKLNPPQKSILKALLENPFNLSTTKLSEKSGTSWNTTDKYLNDFLKKRWVGKRTRGRKGRKEVWYPII